MFLLIDMSVNNKIRLALFDEKNLVEKIYEGMNRELLNCMDSFFVENKFDKQDLQGIMVVLGSGSFTSTRIATVVANTFAYVLKIPLLAIKEDQIDKVQDLITELLKQPKGQYISAKYSGEPNIG